MCVDVVGEQLTFNHGLPRFARNDAAVSSSTSSRHREARSDPWIAALRQQ
jgi:hypothetical protein